MKELDELKEKCIQAMKDVDVFVDEHYDELCDEIREQWNVPKDWIVKIVSNCGIVCGCFRHSNIDEWYRVIYNNGEWMDNNLTTSNEKIVNMEDKKVNIKWIDSRQIHGWALDDDIDDTCCSIESCGFLVRETEDAYTVALSKGYNPLQWCGINVIPKCCVVSIKEINNNE